MNKENEKSKLREIIETLQAENARYRKALGYYANGRELTNRAGADDATLEWVSDEMDISKIDGKWVLGHHAREALKGGE